MKIIVNGANGRMSREVCRMISETEGMTVAATVDKMGGEGMLQSIFDFSGDADVIIDFSHHSASPELIKYAVEKDLPIVIATTGHDDRELEAIEDGTKRVAVFMSANMSLGVALLVELAKKTAKVFPDADIEIIEKHHNRKLDAPSGTALLLAREIQKIRNSAFFTFGRQGQAKRVKDEIGVHAVRMGNIVGEHEVIVGTDTQTITLKHEAHSRALFAEGAIVAADYIIGKPAGLYKMDDMVK